VIVTSSSHLVSPGHSWNCLR